MASNLAKELLYSFINEMANSRFVNVSNEDISQFLEENENKNTTRKTSQDFWPVENANLQETFKRAGMGGAKLSRLSCVFLHSYTMIKCNFLVLQLGGLTFFKHVICTR